MPENIGGLDFVRPPMLEMKKVGLLLLCFLAGCLGHERRKEYSQENPVLEETYYGFG